MRLCSKIVGLFFLFSVLGGFGGGSGIFNPAANSIGDFQGIDSNKASAGPSYTGPGDIAAFTIWGSVARVFSAAKANTSTSLADLVASTGGAAVCTLRGSSTGLVDLAASYCAGTTPALACAAASGGSCKVSKLYDQAGATPNPWIQATLAKMPGLTFSAINGLPAMSFASASSQTMSITSTITQAQPLSYEVVSERTANFSTAQEILSANSSEVDLAYFTSPNFSQVFAGAGPINGAPTDSAFHVQQATFNNTSCSINVDGITQVTGSCGTFTLSSSNLWIGSFNNSSLFLDGAVSEVGMYAGTYNSGVQSNTRTAYGL